jgi:hypothetical protein
LGCLECNLYWVTLLFLLYSTLWSNGRKCFGCLLW